ncbi:multicopper oxidase domain-containing protein [Crystallibacter degradans]|uniref:multicopper oxidase domain-containing protein n=1 Tax=Crystallibacter degradans TaxID=2726743 RepID=UPI001F0DBF69|nr:multicopper oxidase domain-containing protein [Arthrobacter sp. SF27]
MKRRSPRLLALGAAVMLALAGCGSISEVTVPADFDQPLHIPPLAESRIDDDGTRVFDLTAQSGTTDFSNYFSTDTSATETMGFNGSFLGPTLRAKRGEKVAVNFSNQLERTTSVHWHGMHLPAAMDGGPHQEMEPGGTWHPEWLID